MVGFAALAAAAVIGVLVVSAATNGSQGGQPLEPGVVQDAIASDAGVTISVLRAEFSGTGSFLEIGAEADASLGGVTHIRLPADALIPGSIRPMLPGEHVILPLGEPIVVRMAPVTRGQEPMLGTVAIDLRQPDATWKRVTGRWKMQLDLGGSPAEVLRVDHFVPGMAVEDEGVLVRPVRALTSRTETLVTLEIEAPGALSELMLPSIAGSSPRVHGARLTWDGRFATFSFPPVDPRAPLRIELGELIVSGGSETGGYVEIDVDGAMARQGSTGAFAESVLIEPGDQVKGNGAEFDVFRIQFAGETNSTGTATVINIHLSGSYDDPRPFSLALADGTPLPMRWGGTSYPIDGSGRVTSGATYFGFEFGDLDRLRQGSLRLMFGTASTVLRGNWVVQFEPE
jgi:hypothetical protein